MFSLKSIYLQEPLSSVEYYVCCSILRCSLKGSSLAPSVFFAIFSSITKTELPSLQLSFFIINNEVLDCREARGSQKTPRTFSH